MCVLIAVHLEGSVLCQAGVQHTCRQPFTDKNITTAALSCTERLAAVCHPDIAANVNERQQEAAATSMVCICPSPRGGRGLGQ